jgi:hypothetical protein
VAGITMASAKRYPVATHWIVERVTWKLDSRESDVEALRETVDGDRDDGRVEERHHGAEGNDDAHLQDQRVELVLRDVLPHRDNETTRQRDNETTRQRDNETTRQRDNETTRQRYRPVLAPPNHLVATPVCAGPPSTSP